MSAPHPQRPPHQQFPPGYGQQAFQGYPPLPPPPVERRNGFGIAALALALVGLVFCLMPITGFIGFGAGLLALLFALLALGRMRKGQASKGLTIAALVLATSTTIAGFGSMKLFFDILDGFGHSATPPAAVSGTGQQQQSGVGSGSGSGGQQFTAGQTIERDALQISAAPLRKVKPQYGSAMVCSTVTYRNTGTGEQSFNMFDWKIQNPAGVQSAATMAQKGGLHSGQLAPGGTVAGDVCATDAGAKGDYLIINEPVLTDPIRWKATL
jgi:hypothetical protein